MNSAIYCVLLWMIPILYYSGISAGDTQPYLALYAPGDLEYTDVIVKRVGDNLTLVCELRGDANPRIYVWNHVPTVITTKGRSLNSDLGGPVLGSQVSVLQLSENDSGHVVCASPPYSVSKYILVQPRGPKQCARGAFWCGKHCVLASYVCDGFKDCKEGEDEHPDLCMPQPCSRADKLNCTSGRCLSSAACCRPRDSLCRQPACCDEHPRYSRLEGYVEVEYPPLFEDRRAPDEYSFIQSTIYTVTACALIFMIAVVLLVSAICKMHMKRAALRSYNHVAQHHYNYTQRYAQQTHRFPPCYEASRLLEQERNAATISPQPSQHGSPARTPLQCNEECPASEQNVEETTNNRGFPLQALSAIFTQRYRQIPTQCLDVEMTDVRSSSLHSSPTRNRTRLDHYRSPTYCDLNTDLYLNSGISNCGRELNYMSTPVEFFRRRTLRNNLDRVIDRINRPRPLTLQLGRFQLSIPRLGRRQSLDRRPDTPNVAELNIDDLDFVRLNSNDTYTLNGRTIRLLGANFENYPNVTENNVTNCPPPYTEAVRYKLYGPPPEYLSRDGLNNETSPTEAQARSNVEMPPCYDELASNNVTNNVSDNVANNVTVTENNDNTGNNNTVGQSDAVRESTTRSEITRSDSENNGNNLQNYDTQNHYAQNNNTLQTSDPQNNMLHSNGLQSNGLLSNVTTNNGYENNFIDENLSSVIDNLPAIDSDVNANETEVRYSVSCNVNNNEC